MKKTHRFIGKFELSADRSLLRDPALIHQIRTVLKLRVGERLILADGSGQETVVAIAGLAPSGIEVVAIERHPAAEPTRLITLYCAVLKRENFEYVVEKAVETGAHKIVPVMTAHTVKLGLKTERLAKIAQEAAEQSGRGIVPEISEPVKFKAALKAAAEHDVNYFFEAGGDDFSRPRSLAKTIGVWIGPEGGWEDFEVEAARQSNFEIASLGTLILRAETAATVAVYLAAR